MPTLRKQAGAIGLPTGIKDITRADFRDEMWVRAIEAKGYRLAWSRTAQCPCASVSEQTDQADPNCTLCSGSGWLFFRPEGAVVNQKIIGPLTPLQSRLVTMNQAAVVHGIMTGLTGTKRPWEAAGPRLEGMTQCTMRAENKMGYYDRVVCLDASIVYSQIVKASGTATLATRYPVLRMNLLRSKTTVFVEGVDFALTAGEVAWLPNHVPSRGLVLVAHYLCPPTWRVVEHPHTTRLTLTKFKIPAPLTPQGEPQDLPVQALLRYEFLL